MDLSNHLIIKNIAQLFAKDPIFDTDWLPNSDRIFDLTGDAIVKV
jgi:hypothetical protein